MSSLKKKLKTIIGLVVGGTATFTGICIYHGNEKFTNDVLLPLVHRLDPETAHKAGIWALKANIYSKHKPIEYPNLRTKLWDLEIPSPLGMAAGFDKDGEAIEGLHQLGFGFVEVGTVTPLPQPGNPRPRVFRLLEDGAIINRYGFNSCGHGEVFNRIESLRNQGFNGVIGVNLGKNKTSDDPIADYVAGVNKFGPVADYLVINVSSPNTPGLRNLQQKESLTALLMAVLAARDKLVTTRKVPVALKIAPDLTEEEKKDIVEVITHPKCKVDGLIISNTTVSRPGSLVSDHKTEVGGLSGAPLKDMSTKMIREFKTMTKGKIPIIGVGGISTAEDVIEKLEAGATAVQLYSAFTLKGPFVAKEINSSLSELLK
ncbi:dihydroorotate dehydrogenase (quinone), mitochondrial-like isoform X2 [Artemia franciscana]|nr:hypothetical protein QYM36_009892 [Artemia franciscana]